MDGNLQEARLKKKKKKKKNQPPIDSYTQKTKRETSSDISVFCLEDW